MKRQYWIGGIVALAVAGAWFVLKQGADGAGEIEYRYDAIGKGEILRSTSAVGVLVPLTVVDLKSRAGGEINQLLVEEGAEVKKGDLIAVIDPRDTNIALQQAQSDQNSANARVNQARTNAELEQLQSDNSVRDAELRVRQAEIALAKTKESNAVQPILTDSAIKNAESALAAQREAQKNLEQVEAPQRRREADTAVSRTKVELDTAKAELERQKALLAKGYVSKADVERATSGMESASAAYDVAKQRQSTLETSIASDISAGRSRVAQAEASFRQAKAGMSQVEISKQSLLEAEKSLEQARLALKEAKDNRLNIRSRKLDVTAAQASAVRSKVAVENANLQLGFTKVLAPRDGIVTQKYLEEGSIVPPGAGAFSQGINIIQLADMSQMFVECAVDEADIANIRLNQQVRIVVEAYPGQKFNGIVRKVFPAATSANNLVTIKVRVEVLDLDEIDRTKVFLRPQMNATCEFVQFLESDALVLPQSALKTEGEETYVLVKSSDPLKPEKRIVKVGESGNEGVAVLEGLKEGDEVVVAEIDLKAMKDRQAKMEAAASGGGGLGSQRTGGPSQSRRSGATPSGGGR